MAKRQKQSSGKEIDKSKVKVRMSMEEARELFGGELPQGVQKPPRKKGFEIDYGAISLAIIVTTIIFVILTIYFNLTTGKNLIEPLEATPIEINLAAGEYKQEVNEIQAHWNQKEITKADNAIGNVLNQVRNDNVELAKRLYLLRLEGRVIQKKYEQAQELSQVLRSTYSDDKAMLAKVKWYRGLCYFYEEQYYQAVSMFEQVAKSDVEMSDQAAEYAEDIKNFAY